MKRLETRHLPCALTDRELLAKGQLSAQAVKDLRKLEDEKKAWASKYADLIKDKEMELRKLSTEIETGEEVRPVDCYVEPRWSDFMVEISRGDTGALIETRAMTDLEKEARQQALNLAQSGAEH